MNNIKTYNYYEQGSFEDLSFPRLLTLSRKYSLNGIWLLTDTEGKEKKIHIINGKPVFVETNIPEERIGHFLVGKKILSEEKLKEFLHIMAAKKVLLGELLINSGIINYEKLTELIKEQTLKKLLEIFSWDKGEFKFEKFSEIVLKKYYVNLELPVIILDGIRQNYTYTKLEKVLNDKWYSILYKSPSFNDYKDIEIIKQNIDLLERLDGKKTLLEVVDINSETYLTDCQAIYAYYCMKLISLNPEGEDRFLAKLFNDSKEDLLVDDLKTSKELSEYFDKELEDILTPQEDEIIEIKEPSEPIIEDVKADELVSHKIEDILVNKSYDILEEKLELFSKKLEEATIRIKSKNYFEMLGLSPEKNSYNDLHSAYIKSIKDLFIHFIPEELYNEINKTLDEIITRTVEAYKALSTPAMWATYQKYYLQKESAKSAGDGKMQSPKLTEKEIESSLTKPRELPEDVVQFNMGKRLLKNKEYTASARLFKKAIDLNPDVSQYYGYLGWAIYQKSPKNRKDTIQLAKNYIESAISMNSKDIDAYIFLGRIYMEERQYEKSYQMFSKALELDSKNNTVKSMIAKLEGFIKPVSKPTFSQNLVGKFKELASSVIKTS